MSCDICGRHYNSRRLPFLCPVDVRNVLYEPRLAHAAALIRNEQLERTVEAELFLGPLDEEEPSRRKNRAAEPTATLAPSHRIPPGGGAAAQGSAKSRYDLRECERHEILERTKDMAARARQIRADIEAKRRELDRRKADMRQRRADLEAASHEAVLRRDQVQNEAKRAISVTKYSWNRSYESMVATRAFLCMEAAKLYGLRRIRKGSAVRYELGGFEVVDPCAMNHLPPEVISTSLSHVTHILMLACHYLAIRLPAEITLPHRDYPRPTVFSLSSSYSHGEVPFPGTTNLHPPPSSYGRGHEPSQHMPRARPLFVDKAVPMLAKEDGSMHTMFVEGVALLAYNIAWACCSQGVPVGDRNSLDDVFNIGRNLYNLLIGNQLLNNPAGRMYSAAGVAAGSPILPGAATATVTEGNGTAGPANPGSSNGNGGTTPVGELGASTMGRRSHGSAHTFLSDAFVHGFKLPSPNRLADHLKSRLSSESMLPDWEVLDDEAWTADADDHNNMEDGVLRKGNSRHSSLPERRLFGVESVATVITSMDDTVADMSGGSTANARRPILPNSGQVSERLRQAGTSGWTKLRHR